MESQNILALQNPGPSPPLFRSNSSFSEKILTLACLLRAAMMMFWSGAGKNMGVNKCAGAEPGDPPPRESDTCRRTPPPPGRCKLRARSRFMQRSGSCSVVSKGSPSSTMLSRNWAKGVPRCSGRGTYRSLQPCPTPHPVQPPWFPVNPGDTLSG